MCTVTYLPKGNNQFLLTSNRDEAPSRATIQIQRKETKKGKVVLFPQDPQAGGTWLAADDSGRIVCLLNGAKEVHKRQPPYRRSRGLVLLDSFEWASIPMFVERYNFENIEPFTMVIFDKGQLYDFQCRENGVLRQLDFLNPTEAHIWSSVTLYNPEFRAKRQQLFEDWLEGEPEFNLENILQFHQSKGTGDQYNDFVMNRENRVKTISISSFEKTEKTFNLFHKDLTQNQVLLKVLTLA